MLVFSTRLPIKDSVSHEQCVKLFIDWIKNSPHYDINIDDTAYTNTEDCEYSSKDSKVYFTIKFYKDEHIEVSACRLKNCEDTATWINDCIFVNSNGKKSLLIQLNCNHTNFNKRRGKVNVPHIVKSFIHSGYIKADSGIPINGKAHKVEMHEEICTKIIKGSYSNTMPIVYISCDYWNNVAINPHLLAKNLSGLAHVYYETSERTSFILKNKTNSRNVFSQIIGIYFPDTSYYKKFNIKDYNNNKYSIAQAIEEYIRTGLVNRLDSSEHTWNNIILLQSKQKVSVIENVTQEEINSYINTFDAENKNLHSKNKQLQKENYELRAKIDALESTQNKKHSATTEPFYYIGKEPELYPGEYSDLLFYVLSQIYSKYETKSRPALLINSLLNANPKIGNYEKTITELTKILSQGKRISQSDYNKLKKIGFTVKTDGHTKITFKGDKRYLFTIANSPSDHREGKNILSDIKSKLDISHKIL